jgi:putative ABC transport system permease protein
LPDLNDLPEVIVMMSGFKMRLRALLRKSKVEQELDDELRYHLERQTELNLRQGMSPDEARQAALRSFGGLEQAKEKSRDASGMRWVEELWQDLRYGVRMLLKQPGITLIAVLTLALSIGANTAIFSVINTLILDPPHIFEADRVTAIWRTPKDKRLQGYLSYLELQDWQTQTRSFEMIAGYRRNNFIMLNNEEAETIPALSVTANFLSLIKIKPVEGRDFRFEEEKRGAERVVIISHQFWQSRMGGVASAIGQQLTLNSRAYTVIGILPPGFKFPLIGNEIDLLSTITVEGGNLPERGAQILRPIARLKTGVSLTEAQADLTNLLANLEQQYPQFNRNITAYLVPVAEQIVGLEVRRALWVLLGAVAFLLLIACTNVTNLLLVRASARQKELALRIALGASTWRVARQLLSESLLLALISGGAGLLLSTWGLEVIKYYGAEQLPRLEEVNLDARVLAFTFAVSVLTALLFSLLPIIQAARPDINKVLKAGSKTATGGGALHRWRSALVVTEVALGLVLLIGAGLMIRSFGLLINVHPGFDPKNVLMGQISLTRLAYQSTEERVRFVSQTLERLNALPGVESAAFVAPMPFSGGNVYGDFRIDEHPAPKLGDEPAANVRSATPQYFQTIKIPLLKGRYFTGEERRGGIGAVIINDAVARLYFPNEDPLGKHISQIGANQNDGDPERWQIVGVIGDVHHNNLTDTASPEIYLPFQQNSWSWGNFLVRTKTDPTSLTRPFTETIRSGDKTVPVTRVQLLTEAISETVAQARFYTLLFTLFGAAGLVLTLTGIYGVISYTVSQQTQEIGVRMALGAQAGDVLRMVIGQGVVLTLGGIGLGLLGALGLTRLMRTLLFGVSVVDPMTFVIVATMLMSVALIACWVPALRATKVDPLTALRYE